MLMSFGFSSRCVLALPVVVVSAFGAVACSAPATSDSLSEQMGDAVEGSQVGSKLTTACRLETIGLPCDPDGSGAATECEGLCWVNDEAEVSCLLVAAANLVVTDLNGRICGDEQGRDCSRSCENGACVQRNARLGTACRPAVNTTSCDGVCTLVGGEAVCDEVSVCDAVAVADDGCTLTACNFETFEQGCTAIELANPVCEASQAQNDAGPSAGDGGSSQTTLDAAVVPPGAEAGQGSTAPDAEVTTTGVSTTSQSAGSSASDAGPADAGSPIRTPVRVVGGACGIAAQPGSRLGAWGAFAAGVLVVGRLVSRRKRLLTR